MLHIDKSLPLSTKVIIASSVFTIGFVGSLISLSVLFPGSSGQILSRQAAIEPTSTVVNQDSSAGRAGDDSEANGEHTASITQPQPSSVNGIASGVTPMPINHQGSLSGTLNGIAGPIIPDPVQPIIPVVPSNPEDTQPDPQSEPEQNDPELGNPLDPVVDPLIDIVDTVVPGL